MPTKRKKTSNKPSSKNSITVADQYHHYHACAHSTMSLGTCWLCWLFKVLIILFAAFLLLWVGYLFGLLKGYDIQTHDIVRLERITKGGGFCGGTSAMSHTLSANAVGLLQENIITSLKDLSGETFDKEFLIQMMLQHEGTIEMANLALEKSQDPEIIKLAQTIIDQSNERVQEIQSLNLN